MPEEVEAGTSLDLVDRYPINICLLAESPAHNLKVGGSNPPPRNKKYP
jgi:hypothetical protein